MTKTFDKVLLWTLRIGLVLTLFSPLVISFKFLFPYIVPRATYFQVITEIMLAVSIVLVSFYPEYRPKLTNISKAVILFFAVVALSTVTSLDIGKSFIGTIERSFGFWNIVHFGFLYFAAIVALKTSKAWNVMFSISIVVSTYAALDMLLPRIFSWLPPSPTIAGNPTFTTAFIIFNLFFALYLTTKTKNKWIIGILYSVIIMQAAAITVSQVRGAFVGMCAGIISILLYLALTSQKTIRIYTISALVALIVLYGLVFLNRNNPLFKSNGAIQRMTNFSQNDTTIQSRLLMWGIALKGFEERPVLGWGAENYPLVFAKYFDPNFNGLGLGEAWEDRTHNVIFEELVDSGIAGLASYVFLMLAALVIVRKNPIFIALLVAYNVQNLFGVDTINSFIPLFIFFAYCYFVANQHTKEQFTDVKTADCHQFSSRQIITALISSIVVVYVSWLFTFTPALANYNMFRAYISIVRSDYTGFNKSYEESIKISKNLPSLKLEMLGIVAPLLLEQGDKLFKQGSYAQYSDKIIKDYRELYDRNELDQRWIFTFARTLLHRGLIMKDISFLHRGNNVLEELIAVNPRRQLFITALQTSKKIEYLLEQERKTTVK